MKTSTSIKKEPGKIKKTIAKVTTKNAQHTLVDQQIFSKILSAPTCTRIRSIGNSNGIILSNQLLNTAGFSSQQEVSIQATEGAIIITPFISDEVNTDLSTWDAQFEKAVKSKRIPEKDLFDGITNNFDEKEW